MKGLILGLALLISGCSRAQTAVPAASAPPTPSEESGVAWVQVTGSGLEARALAPAGSCPAARLDGQAVTLRVRAPAAADFPAVCALSVPAGSHQLSVEGKDLPLRQGTPERIVVIGDTGCRIKYLHSQPCNDPLRWPFARIAALAAARSPDLVIHVGDYYYRENPCPLGLPTCAGSPYGDRMDTWRVEFFDPAAPLLAAAPMIFVRGNHEGCARGGRGWYRLLDAGPWQPECAVTADAFVAHLGALALGVVDSSEAEDRQARPQAVAAMRPQFDRLARDLGSGESFILTHRPIWAAVPLARMGPFGRLFVQLNHTEQAAIRGRVHPTTSLVLSGHVHHFAAYSYGPTRPAQLVAGEGGDEGIPDDRPDFDRQTVKVDGLPARKLSFARYGYVLMDRTPQGWRIEAHDLEDRIAARCTLVGRDLSCLDGVPAGKPTQRPF